MTRKKWRERIREGDREREERGEGERERRERKRGIVGKETKRVQKGRKEK